VLRGLVSVPATEKVQDRLRCHFVSFVVYFDVVAVQVVLHVFIYVDSARLDIPRITRMVLWQKEENTVILDSFFFERFVDG